LWIDKSDEELMALYQEDNFEAFQELYRRHSRRLMGYLRKRWTPPPGGPGVDDLLQTVFLKLHSGRGSYQKRYPFLPWLFSVTQHVLIDTYRQKKYHVKLMESLSQNEATPDSPPSEVFEVLKAQLSLAEYELLKMRFEEGLSFEELSRATGKGTLALRKQVSRLMQKLRVKAGQEKPNG